MDCDMSLSVDNTSSSSVQNDRISSSSDMDGTEPPIKKSKIAKDNDIEDSQPLKENGATLNQVQPLANHHDNILNNHDVSKSPNTKNTTPNKQESSPVNGVKSDSPTKADNGIVSKNDKSTVDDVDALKDVKDIKQDANATSTADDDPYAGLEWKDGIATLPGSNLKFKMTEFGTLEIVSTISTEKGESEWSTASQSNQESSSNKTDETSTQVLVIKKGQEDKKPSSKSESRKAIKDPTQVLCCEVCGKYGLPKDFSASGRFCSLKCVGQYTGRRNKGREFVRQVKTLDGKIIKKRKKKTPENSTEGESSQRATPKTTTTTEQNVDKSKSVPVTIKKIKGTKKKTKRIHLDAASLASTDNVPYDSSKPFVWVDYLAACNAKAVPVSVFQQENPELNMFPKPFPEYLRSMKLEAVDPRHPSYICVCTVVRVRGARFRLHFDGWSESYDFWTNADSPLIFPIGWCEKNGQTVSPPRGMNKNEFSHQSYLAEQNSSGVPPNFFQPVSPTRHGFKVGMKLEAIDRKNPDLICVATVTNVIGNRFLVHFDEWDDTYDYWCEEDCPYIHPIGWCEANGGKLNPPNDDEVDTFTWEEYLKTTGAIAAPKELFKKRFAPGYKQGQKLEAVDKRNPSLIRAGTVVDVEEYKVKVHFDGWDDIFDEWYDAESTDLHPVSYCEKTGHPLEPPLTRADKISSAACPTPGCKGIGHVKGAKYSSHHSTFGCPYSLQNLNKESPLVDRLSTNSMTEESDYSYVKKSREDPSSPTDVASPTPSTDGNSRVINHWRNRTTTMILPNSCDMPISRRPSHRSLSSYSTKTTSSNASSSFAVNNHSPNCANVKLETRRHSFKEEKALPAKTKYVEKGIQYVSPYYPHWGYGFAKIPVNGRREYYPLHDESPSKEKMAMEKWTTEQVEKHVASLGCTEQAKLFVQQEIDGEAFLLLTQSDIVNIMKIKLGPALKIFNSIPKH